MPWMICFIAALSLSCLLIGHELGQHSERAVISNECRQAGKITVKRTGFSCEVIRK